MEKKVVGKEMEKVLEFGERDEKRLWVWGKRWEKACRDGEIEIEKKKKLVEMGESLVDQGKIGEKVCGAGGKNMGGKDLWNWGKKWNRGLWGWDKVPLALRRTKPQLLVPGQTGW